MYNDLNATVNIFEAAVLNAKVAGCFYDALT